MALPYAVHVTGQKVTDLEGNVYACPWFDYVHHGQQGRTTR
jgi:hypothetical protein